MKYHRLLLPQETFDQILSSHTFKCHNYEGIASLPWQQDFYSNKYYSGLLFPQGTCLQTMKFVSLQTAKLSRYVPVAMVTERPWQQFKAWIAVASRNLCTKYEVYLPLNSKDISLCFCCHGNKVSIATSDTIDSCGLKGPMYQIRSSYIFKQQSHKHMPLLPW